MLSPMIATAFAAVAATVLTALPVAETASAATGACRPGDRTVVRDGRRTCLGASIPECLAGVMRVDSDGLRDACVVTTVVAGRVVERPGLLRCDATPGGHMILLAGTDLCVRIYQPAN